MILIFNGIEGDWADVKDTCLATIRKPAKGIVPTDEWKRRLLLSEHSPIRKMVYKWTWRNLPYWVSAHLVRHHVGINHFVASTRSELVKCDRGDLPQRQPVDHEVEANAQAIINLSRKRLCGKASAETREACRLVVEALQAWEPALASVCVPECVYRGFCPEMQCCGYVKSQEFTVKRFEYITGRGFECGQSQSCQS